jgi:ketosteroid isomerase-like protein
MLSPERARAFAREWIDAWNSHDLDRILSHYADDFEMTSPFIVDLMKDSKGTIKGKEKVRAYWAEALRRIPDLHFQVIEVLVGVNTVTIYYHAVLGKRAAEVLFFNAEGKVNRGIAHYHT